MAQSKLQKSLSLLLQQEPSDNLVILHFLAAVNELDINVAQLNIQALTRQAYQNQLITHAHIKAAQNALYVQSLSYQAKLQYQENLS